MNKLNLGLLDEDFSNRDEKDSIQKELDFAFDGRMDFEKLNEIDSNRLNDFNNQQMNNQNNIKKPSGNPNKKLFHNLGDFQFKEDLRIKIFGIGGAGNNMINHMARNSNIENDCLFAINTDYQVLKTMPQDINLMMIGGEITKGYGSGSDPEIGRQAALESESTLREVLKDTDLLFIVSGMGKGTGTGASPVVAQIAKEMGVMTLSLVNLPSISNEGPLIYKRGNDGLKNLNEHTSGILTISNEKLFNETSNNISLMEAFSYANSVISNVIYDLITLINNPSKINVDFNDVKTFFKDPTEFQVNTFIFNNEKNIEQDIINQLNEQIYQDNLVGGKKAIVNFKLNPNVNREFVNNLTQALVKITKNDNLEVTLAIDYFDNIECAIVTTVISMEKNINDNDEKYTRTKSSLLVNDSNSDVEELEIINTSNLESESKPKTIELNRQNNYYNQNNPLPNPYYNSNTNEKMICKNESENNEFRDALSGFNELKKEIEIDINVSTNNEAVIEQDNSYKNSINTTQESIRSWTRRSFIPTRKISDDSGNTTKRRTMKFLNTSNHRNY